MARKTLIVPMTLVMHTKLKWQAKNIEMSMSAVVRSLIEMFINGDIEIDPYDLPKPPRKPSPRKQRPSRDLAEAEETAIDQIAALVAKITAE